jgi:hypothetical protein
MLRWQLWVAAVWYGRVRNRGSVLEHCHVCRGWVQLVGGWVTTSFFCLEAFNISYDTWLRHRLVWILCKVCFRGCVSLLYPYQPGNTSVHFACLWCRTVCIMIVIGSLYYMMYIFWVMVNRMIVDVPFCVCPRCCVVPCLCACSLLCLVSSILFHICGHIILYS